MQREEHPSGAGQGMVLTVLTYLAMLAALGGVFLYAPTEKTQGIVQRIFYFHVSSAVTMFLAFSLVFVMSVFYLWKQAPGWTEAAARQGRNVIAGLCVLLACALGLMARVGAALAWEPTLVAQVQQWGGYLLLLLGLVCVASVLAVRRSAAWFDAVAASAAEVGVVFCTLVLITGPIWARPIWGVWWSWDPTLTFTLVLWLIYVAYLMLRAEDHDPRRARLAAILGIIGFVDIPIIRWSVEKWRTLHPKPVVMQPEGTTGLTPAMLVTFLVCVAAFTLLFFVLLRARVALAQHRRDLDLLRQELDEALYG